MKLGVIGAGRAGAACLSALVLRNSAREIVVINLDWARANAVAADLRYGIALVLRHSG